MGDFSFVREQGRICGLWIKQPADANDQAYVMTLFFRGGLTPADVSAGFRVVPNRVDNNGGCFVMLGSTRAPGE